MLPRLLRTVAWLLTAIALTLAGLGYFIDASEPPHKADLIVSLGGGDGRRIKEAARLWQQGYATSGRFLYTGREIVNPALEPPQRFDKRSYLLSQGIPPDKIRFVPRGIIVNTAEELFFIKAYMLRHGYRSVLIVSSPTHTRRIRLLARWIAGFQKAGLRLYVSSFPDPQWHPWRYLFDPVMRHEVFLEAEKIIYNLLKYAPPTIGETSYGKKRDTKRWRESVERL